MNDLSYSIYAINVLLIAYLNLLTLYCAVVLCSYYQLYFISLFMVALCNRETIYIFMLFLLLSFFYSSPNLSGRRLDVCHTSTHGLALVRI